MFDLKSRRLYIGIFLLAETIGPRHSGVSPCSFLLLGDLFGNSDSLYRFGTYAVTAIGLYPIDKFNRFDFSLSWYDITKDNLDDPFTPTEEHNVFVPSISYVHDNTLWGINGTCKR